MKDLKPLEVIGGSVALTICLIGMAWGYGEVKKIEGRQEAAREFEMRLLNLKIDLENDWKKRKEEA